MVTGGVTALVVGGVTIPAVGLPPGYTWLLWGGQKVYFNGEPVYVLKEST